MDVKTYGSLAIRDGVWYLRAEPHVTIRIKRIFPRMSPTAQGVLAISDTLDVCRDLEWLAGRWPLQMAEEVREYLTDRVDRARATEQILRDIQAGHRLSSPDFLDTIIPPRDYQLAAADVVLATGRLVAVHGIGMGKTYTGLLVLREPKARPALVTTLGGMLPAQWVAQVRKFFPQLVAVIAPTGEITDKVRDRLLTADVVVLPYSRLAKYQPLLQGHVRTTIYDEAQELRHAGTQKYIAAQAVSSEAAYRVGLTGTLIYGYAGEAWDITEVHEPGALGDKTEFTREWGGVTASGGNLSIADAGPLGAYLREQGLMEVKSRADVGMPVNEPDIQEFNVEVDESVIDAARRDVAAIAQAILDKQGTRQEQFAWEREMDWRMREATGRAKAPGVAELVRLILAGQQRVLLFGWHHSVYGIWMRELAEFNPVRYTGTETTRQKADTLRAFGRDSRVCMMSLRAGAGLDGIQEHCSALVIGELDWSPAVHLQNIGRLDRDGQKDPVFGFIATTDYGSDPLMTEVLGLKKREERTLTGVELSQEPTLSNTDRILRMARDVLDRRQPTRPHPAAEGAAAE